MQAAVLLAATTANEHEVWRTLLFIVAIIVAIGGLVQIYRGVTSRPVDGSAIIIGVGLLFLAAVIGPGGVSLFT